MASPAMPSVPGTPPTMPAAEPPPVLRLEGITKRFGRLVANDAISLTLQAGEVLALLGENGAGKSTLMSILFGHYTADAGRIEVFGRRLPPGHPKAALAAGIGMVHQHFALADNLSVLDNVLIGGLLRRDVAGARAFAAECLARVGLSAIAEKRAGDLSFPERARVEVARALATEPKVLLLDEVMAALNHAETAEIVALFRQLQAETSIPLSSPTLADGGVTFYREDDVAATAYFYLDRPENGLPRLAPVAERTAALR